jgi:D-alanyl-D-alanine carboxypeptidase (penicillin-binding protein 5/6)
VGEAQVWIGAEDTVPLTPATDVIATVPFGSLKDMTVTVRYNGPVAAPIAMGDQIAELVIEAPGIEPLTAPLIAANSVDKGGLMARLSAVISTVFATAESETPVAVTE